jgi:PAS domain S-box-containing protein
MMNNKSINGGNRFQWESTVRRLIVCVAVLFALAPPVLYLLFALEEQKINIEAESHILAHTITDQINENPEYWQYEKIRFSSLLSHRLDKGNYLERRQLYDINLKVVAESNDALQRPLISIEKPVFDAGDPVGSLKITRSIRSILQISILILLASSSCGALVYYILHVFPLKALRLAFAALYVEKEQATVTLRSIADAVITTDTSLRINSLNPAAALMAGLNGAEIGGKPFQEYFKLVRPFTQEVVDDLLEGCLYSDGTLSHIQEDVVFVRQVDGREFQIELTVSPLHDENENLLGLVVVFHDVTASRQLEKQLRDKALELDLIVKYAGVGIAFVRGGVIQRVNALATEIIGSTQEDISGQSVPLILSSHLGIPEPFDHIYETLVRGEAFDIERQVVRPDKKQIWLRLIGQAVDPSRLREIGSVWIAQDITVLKQHQEELHIARVHAEAASRFKSEFLAEVSHELRSPLSGIIGMNRLVLDTDLNSVQRRYLGIVQASAETLLQLINNLLDLSKIEAGVMELEEKPFCISCVFNYVENIACLRANEKGLLLRFSRAEEIPDVLIGDELRLGQILLNLVSNAITFTAEGGVEIRCEMISQTQSDVQLRFRVIDTGCGIDESAREKIFEAFMQASLSVARTHGGTGLGLSICKKLTELMGGDITVESKPGEGSTFSFTGWFKCEEKRKADVVVEDNGEVNQIENTHRQPLQILLVDDLPFNQTIAKLVLEREGHYIHLAANGREALVALTKSTFDVIFMDVQMPVMDGLVATRHLRLCERGKDSFAGEEDNELMRKITSKMKGSHIPIIAMTGNGTEAGKTECFEAGMDNYICKPFERIEILRVLKVICDTFPLLAEKYPYKKQYDRAKI